MDDKVDAGMGIGLLGAGIDDPTVDAADDVAAAAEALAEALGKY